MNTIENVFWFRLHFLHKTEFHRIHACDGLSVLLLPSLLFTYSHQLRVGARITCTLHAMNAIEIRIRSWKWTLANAWNVVTARRRCLHPNAMDQYNCVRVSARARSNTPNAVFHATNEFSIWVFCLAARPFMRAKPNRRQIIVRPHLDVRCAPNICVRRQNYYFTNYCDRKNIFPNFDSTIRPHLMLGLLCVQRSFDFRWFCCHYHFSDCIRFAHSSFSYDHYKT